MRVASHRGLPEPRECPQDWAAHRSGRPSGNGVVALLEGRFDDLAGMFRAGGGLDWGDELSRVSEEARGRASPGSVGTVCRLGCPVSRCRSRAVGNTGKGPDTQGSHWSLDTASWHEPAPAIWDRL